MVLFGTCEFTISKLEMKLPANKLDESEKLILGFSNVAAAQFKRISIPTSTNLHSYMESAPASLSGLWEWWYIYSVRLSCSWCWAGLCIGPAPEERHLAQSQSLSPLVFWRVDDPVACCRLDPVKSCNLKICFRHWTTCPSSPTPNEGCFLAQQPLRTSMMQFKYASRTTLPSLKSLHILDKMMNNGLRKSKMT